MIFQNRTTLNTERLQDMFLTAIGGWPVDGLDIRIRYSRGADFSGTCFYERSRLHVNLGGHLRYPYRMRTYVARASTSRSTWWKPLYTIELADGYQVVTFVLLHEYYHWLVRRAERNTRRKEAMCDRFATRALVDHFGAAVRCPKGRPVPRGEWDFQDLDRFVARALLTRRATSELVQPFGEPTGLFAEAM
ncbi:MAG: hypothetical protein HOP29_04005 [Phycisphaerales bacterium]|nr:hypothetical protein [Phycisphaerales bacterium]